jgi:hypothetical protein
VVFEVYQWSEKREARSEILEKRDKACPDAYRGDKNQEIRIEG